jgi:hypothetical protein
VTLVLLGRLSSLTAWAEEPWKEPLVVKLSPQSQGKEEVAFMDLSGVVRTRIRGFEKIAHVEVVAPHRTLIVDQGRHEVVLVSASSTRVEQVQSWNVPDPMDGTVGAALLESGSVLLLDRSVGLVRLDSTTRRVVPLNGSKIPKIFRSILRSKDGRFIVTGAEDESSPSAFFVVDLSVNSIVPIAVSPDLLNNGAPKYASILQGPQDFVLWSRARLEMCTIALAENTITPRECRKLSDVPVFIFSDSTGGFVSLVEHGYFARYDERLKKIGQFGVEVSPRVWAMDAASDQLVLGYQRIQGEVWPDPKLVAKTKEVALDWNCVGKVSVGAFLLALLVFFVLKRISKAKTNEDNGAQNGSSSSLKDVSVQPPALFAWLAMVSAGVVAYLCQRDLLLQENLIRLGFIYLGAAVVFAFILQRWRRKALGRELPMFGLRVPQYSSKTPASFVALVVVAMLILSWLIIGIRIDPLLLTKKAAMWFSALALLLSLAVADAYSFRHNLRELVRREWGFLAIICVVTSATLFYDLVRVPINTHFDFAVPALWAWRIAAGVESDFWINGYTPVPAAGLFPDIFAVLALGPTPFAFRFGPAMFGLFGVLAVYFLGRAYRGAWLGFWAALFAAGNVAYIHFARMSTNGTAHIVAFFVITFFVLAWKSNLPSLWAFLGFWAGMSMYEWPAPRTASAAIAICTMFALLRYPRAVLSRYAGFALATAGFIVMVAPLVQGWIIYPGNIFPRAGSMDPIPSPYPGILGKLHSAFGPQFFRCFGWLFFEGDHSSQGSVSPGLNTFEAVLCAIGLAVLLFEGLSLNFLLWVFMIITLVIGGSFTRTAWHTRLLTTALVAVIAMGRSLDGLREMFASYGKRVGTIFACGVSVVVIGASPIWNLNTYLEYERGAVRSNLMDPMTAIGRKIYEKGPGYEYLLVTVGDSSWRLRAARQMMFPYIIERKIRELVELDSEVLSEISGPVVFFVKEERLDKEGALILKRFPSAKMEKLEGLRGEPIGLAIIVDAPSAAS